MCWQKIGSKIEILETLKLSRKKIIDNRKCTLAG